MNAIGFRAEKNILHWAVVSGTNTQPILEAWDKLRAPVTYSESRALSWFRDQVSNLFTQYEPEAAGIRYPETFMTRPPTRKALPSWLQRARIEGVVSELCSSHDLEVSIGGMQQIASRMGTKSAKKYLDADDLRGIDLGDIRNANARDAVLVACSALGE